MEVHGYTEDGSIDITINGQRGSVPDDITNRHRQMIAVWEAEGNTIPEYVPPTVALVAYAAQKRWECEVGGTTWNGWPVHTDRESQGKIVAERLAIEAGVRDDPDSWKFADGKFRIVSNSDFIALTNAVRGHVRQCFAIEAAVLAGIAAEQITTPEEIDAAFAQGD